MPSKPLRVALFFTTLELGGTERQAITLLSGISRKQVTPVVYALRGGSLEETLHSMKIPVRVMERENIPLYKAAKTIRFWLRSDNISVLHSLLWHTNIISRFACLGTRVRCVNSIRWAEWRFRDCIDYLTRWRVDAWIANSEHGARLACLPKTKTTIINNGLEKSLLKTPLSAWKPVPKTITMVAQFRREKRYDVFIRAAKLAPEWTFQCVGDGDNMVPMQKLAQSIGARNVRFLGKRSDVRTVLLRSTAVVLLSRSEGSPNVALEAMALGVPFIGSDIPAHRTLLAQKRGIVIADGGPRAVVDSLHMLAAFSSQELRVRRERAQLFVRKNYASTDMITRTVRVWSSTAQVLS